MTDRDRQRLLGVHPDLIAALVRVFDEMDADKAPLFIVSGVRTQAEQMALYAQGRTVKGAIVTYKDGIRHRSNHQPHADHYGHAVDVAFLGPQPFDPRHPWEALGELAESLGLIWGGRFLGLRDLGHLELPDDVGLKA